MVIMKSSPFSIHNLNPSLVEEVEHAYAKNVEAGRVLDDKFTGDVAVDGLATLLIQQAQHDRDNQQGDSALNKIANPETRKAFQEMFLAEESLFGRIGVEVPTPDKLEEALFNFEDLAEIYERMESDGRDPHVVLTPHGRTEEFWKEIYSNLANDPSTPLEGNGLVVDNIVQAQWPNVSALPTGKYYNHLPTFMTGPPEDQQSLANHGWTLRIIPGTPPTGQQGVPFPFTRVDHMTASEYLTLQATLFESAKNRAWNEGQFGMGTWLEAGYADDQNEPYALVGASNYRQSHVSLEFQQIAASYAQHNIRRAQW